MKPIAIYSGRFQPFHKGHYSVYQHLVDKFGKDNVFVASSNITDNKKSPMSFAEKKLFMTKLFGIPSNKIVQVQSTYAPQEIVSRFPKNTPVVFAVSDKDADRLKNEKFYEPWSDTSSKQGYRDKGYYIVAPEFKMDVGGKNISGTQVRQVMSDPNTSTHDKQQLFKTLYGKFDHDLFKLLTHKISTAKASLDKEMKAKEELARKRERIRQNKNKKIKNPETGNLIKVTTALTYDKNHPAHKAAIKLLQSETITLPVDVGDTILMGKWKNKKIVVKDIDKDEHGMPTINGKKATTFRIPKENINEGGAAGHMAHPFDDQDLTFKDLKRMLHRGMIGNLSKEAPVTEKTDGQNLMATFKDGKIRFARTPKHLANAGKDALTSSDFDSMFRSDQVREVYKKAAKDLELAIRLMTPKQRDKIFKNGQSFVNMEVIHPETKNVIPYDKPIIIFHNVFDVDKEGNKQDPDQHRAYLLSQMIKQMGAEHAEDFSLSGPRFISMSDQDNEVYKSKYRGFAAELDKIAKKYGLSDKATIGDYYKEWWKDFIKKSATAKKFDIPDEQIASLANRWATGATKGVVSKHLTDPKAKLFFKKVEQNLPSIRQSMQRALENVVLPAGAYSLLRSTDYLTSTNPKAGYAMRAKLKAAIDQLRTEKDPAKKAAFKVQIRKLAQIGLKNIVPTEGAVFMYGGKLYKFTGSFAPINQLFGTLGFEFKRQEHGKEEAPKKKSKFDSKEFDKKITNPLTHNKIKIRSALTYGQQHPAYKLAKRELSYGRK